MGAVRGKVIALRGAAIDVRLAELTAEFAGHSENPRSLRSPRTLRLVFERVRADSLFANPVFQLPDFQGGEEQAFRAGKGADSRPDWFSVDCGRAFGATLWTLRPAFRTRTNGRFALAEVSAWIQRCHNCHTQRAASLPAWRGRVFPPKTACASAVLRRFHPGMAANRKLGCLSIFCSWRSSPAWR